MSKAETRSLKPCWYAGRLALVSMAAPLHRHLANPNMCKCGTVKQWNTDFDAMATMMNTVSERANGKWKRITSEIEV